MVQLTLRDPTVLYLFHLQTWKSRPLQRKNSLENFFGKKQRSEVHTGRDSDCICFGSCSCGFFEGGVHRLQQVLGGTHDVFSHAGFLFDVSRHPSAPGLRYELVFALGFLEGGVRTSHHHDRVHPRRRKTVLPKTPRPRPHGRGSTTAL